MECFDKSIFYNRWILSSRFEYFPELTAVIRGISERDNGQIWLFRWEQCTCPQLFEDKPITRVCGVPCQSPCLCLRYCDSQWPEVLRFQVVGPYYECLKNSSVEFLQMWYKHTRGLKDVLIRFWCSKIKGRGHVASQSIVFPLWMRFLWNTKGILSHQAQILSRPQGFRIWFW